MALVAGAKIGFAGVFQMSKEDVDNAIKGLPRTPPVGGSVALPVARFRFSCKTIKECKGGQWVTHRTSGMTMLGAGDPSFFSFDPGATNARNIAGQIEAKAAGFNSAANIAIADCLRKCQ